MSESRLRSVRIPDDIWQAAQERAAEKGETVSAVILRALKRYGRSSGTVQQGQREQRLGGHEP